jgi:tRNA-dihydrouridine synthase
MIGRGAMTSPWLFRQVKRFLETGEAVPDPSMEERWSHILCHCRMAVAESGSEKHAMAAMRGRLMAYSKGMPCGRNLRAELQQVSSVVQVEEISERHLAWLDSSNTMAIVKDQ